MIETRVHPHNDGSITFERVQDCVPILEHSKALHNAGNHGSNEFRHAASLPAVLVERYCNDHNITFHEFMANRDHIKAMCNDPSLSGFRIWKGQV